MLAAALPSHTVYDEILNKLVCDLKEINYKKISQPQLLAARIKARATNYLEDVFWAVEHEKKDAQRIYNTEQQKEITILLKQHLTVIKDMDWGFLGFNLIEFIDFTIIGFYDKYHININLSPETERPIRLKIEKEIKGDHNLSAISNKGIFQKYSQFSLLSVFEDAGNFISRMTEYSVFVRSGPSSFKAYYIDPEEKEIKRSRGNLLMEVKPEGLFIKEWQPCSNKYDADEVKVEERALTQYEVTDFKISINALQKTKRYILKSFCSKQGPWLPPPLAKIICEYTTYKTPFKLIGEVGSTFGTFTFNDHQYLDRRPGLEIFDRMKSGNIYKRHKQTYYYCYNFNLIHCWKKKKLEKENLEKGNHDDYYYCHPLEKTDGNRGPGDAIVRREKGWSFDTQNQLRFFNKCIKKKPKKGEVYQKTMDPGKGVLEKTYKITFK